MPREVRIWTRDGADDPALVLSWTMTFLAMLDGMAKPMPMLPRCRSPGDDVGVMPTTSPFMLMRGPPLLPVDGRVGLDEVLVALRVDRPALVADDAAVTVCSMPRGCR